MDVAFHIVRESHAPFLEAICIVNLPGQPPRCFCKSPDVTKHEVNLAAEDWRWSQFAYQFSYEIGHVPSGHNPLRDNPNNWFHEAICELASFFVLRRMAERSPVDPPIGNWSDYSAVLTDHAAYEEHKYRKVTPTGRFSVWLRTGDWALCPGPNLPEEVRIVAFRLPPLFEKALSGLNVTQRLPASRELLHE